MSDLVLVGVMQGGRAMGISDRRNGERLQCGDADDRADPAMALQDLQKENESLKELVVSLSELVIKRIADPR
ncbi:MAG: hypothetical protein ACOY6K_24640 [Pseudomonadota bacterium]